MKVYAVIGGWDHENEDFDSLKLFDCKSAAEVYRIKLTTDYDYTLMEERKVCEDSAFIDDGVSYYVS